MMAPDGGIRLRPMTMPDILDATVSLYRRNFVTFTTAMGIYALAQAVFSIVVNLSTVGLAGSSRFSTETLIGIGAAAVPLGLLLGLASLASWGAVIHLSSEAVLGRPLDVGAAYRVGFGRLLSIVWVAI